MLKQAKYYFPEACLKTLYSSIVESYFRYCCSVWVTCSATEKTAFKNFTTERLELSLAANLMLSAEPLVEGLGWKTIDELITEESKIIFYKPHYGLVPQYLCHLFVRNSTGEDRPLRNTFY